jgi:hypothetical protein
MDAMDQVLISVMYVYLTPNATSITTIVNARLDGAVMTAVNIKADVIPCVNHPKAALARPRQTATSV